MDSFPNLRCCYSTWWHHELDITTTYSTISNTWPNKITWWQSFLHKLCTIPTSICKHLNFRSTFIALATSFNSNRCCLFLNKLSTNTQLNILSLDNTKLNVNESESNLLKHEGKQLLTELGIFLSTKCSEKVNENIFKYYKIAIVRWNI